MSLLPLVMLLVGTSADVWVTTEDTAPACSAMALSGAISALRPDLHVRINDPHPGDMHVSLERSGATYTLRMVSPHESVERSFPDVGDCDALMRTAALMVDGALDDLPLRDRLLRIETVAPPKPPPPVELLVGLIGGVHQGPVNVAPAFGLELQFRRGWLELSLSGAAVTPTSSPIAAGTSRGSFVTTGALGEIAGGIGPRLGPGWLSVDAVIGLDFTFVQVASAVLFQRQAAMASEPFLAIRAGYALQLPWQFFLGVRIEERYAPRQATFDVEGTTSQVSTRTWTAEGVILLGRRFF